MRAGLQQRSPSGAPGVLGHPPVPARRAVGPSSPGRPLGRPTRALMEGRLGHDFAAVRVHDGPAAVAATRALGASAYAIGRDIVWGARSRPEEAAGRRLLAHELAHVAQQSGAPKATGGTVPVAPGAGAAEAEAERAAAAAAAGRTFPVGERTAAQAACSPLDVADIRRDIADGLTTPPVLYSWLQVRGERDGEVGFAADSPPAGVRFSRAPVPTDPSRPIAAFFFPSYRRHHEHRALVLGGFHGNEHPGFEIADALVARLRSPAADPGFHTLVVPRVNPGGVAANSRCNPQQVDLNRNFPTGGRGTSPVCANTAAAPEQPETEAVRHLVDAFQPHRILSVHSIGSPDEAGVFADPSTDPAARSLACSMAGRILDPGRNARGNRLTATTCDPTYPGAATGPASFGAYAPTRSIPGQTVPVITLEGPRHQSLNDPGHPGTAPFLPAVEEFLR